MHDPVSNLLTSLRNASAASLPLVVTDHSRLKEAIARTLQEEGYVASVQVEGDKLKKLKITLKSDRKGNPITKIIQVSTPGLRRYTKAQAIPYVLGGMGIAILSTSKGIMTGTKAFKLGQGGEILCYVW